MPTANTKKSTGRKGRIENLRPWKKGQSGNPKGRPREGESWAGIIKRMGNMTGVEVAQYFAAFATQFRKIGTITLKEAVVARVYIALVHEPSGSLFNALLDRADGKVTQPIDVNWRDEMRKAGIDPDVALEKLVHEFIQAAAGSAASGGVEGSAAPAADAPVSDAG